MQGDVSQDLRWPVQAGEMAERIRGHDWSASPLGPIQGWPENLRTAVDLMLASQAPASVFWGADQIQLYNDGYVPVAAGGHAAALGRTAADNWTGINGQFVLAALSRALAGETVTIDEQAVSLRTADGGVETRHFTGSFLPVRGATGDVDGIFHELVDVTERVRAGAELREKEERLRLVIDGATGYAIITIDPERRVTSWSRGATEVFGYSAEEMIGKSGDLIFTPEDRAARQPEKEIEAARQTGCANDERWHLRKDGSRVFMNGAVHPLPNDASGRERGFIKVARDETEQRTADQAIADSELRFRNMADGAPVMMWVTDPTGYCAYLNRRWYEFTGREDGSGEAYGWLDAVHPEDRAKAEEAFTNANAEQRDYWVEFRLRRADGVYRWTLDAAAANFDRDGRYLGYVGSVIDIDERRDTEVALRRAKDLLQAVMESVPGVVYAKDRDGRMLAANRGTSELVGKPLSEILGHTDREFLGDAEQADAVMANDRRVMAQDRTEVLEEEVSLPDGSRATWLSTKSPFRDADGEVVGLVGASLDITERKRSEEKLREREARLRFLSEMDEALRVSPDAPAAMLSAAELLARQLDASRCAYADVDADHDSFVIRDDYTAPGIASTAGSYRLDLFGKRAAAGLRKGEMLVIRDVARELASGDGRETFQSIGIEAIVCCPLMRQGGLVAMMAVHQDRARDWHPAEVGLIEATVERCWAHVERIGAEARLRESEERLRLATEAAEVGFWDVDLVNDQLIWPPRVKAMFGISADVPVTLKDFYDGLHPDDRDFVGEAFAAAGDPRRKALYDVEYRTIGKEDGLLRWVAAKGRGVFDAGGRCVRVIGSAIDVTARKQIEERLRELNENLERKVEEEVAERAKTEEQLRQAQKMEAVGQLTGGIAHDFNNLLTGVIGSLDMLQRRLAKGETDKVERYAATAITAANRAAALTHRLLAFARRQPLDPKPVNANRLVTGMEELIRRTIGEAVSLEIVTAGGLWQTLCDPNQLESAILNLAINARDAMPAGGKLTIETCNTRLDESYAAKERDVVPGQYICICVTDTGTGMTADVISKAFEPFFTTKPIGQGTGLGLSMIYGFARQSEGFARIYSEVGQGSTVKLYSTLR